MLKHFKYSYQKYYYEKHKIEKYVYKQEKLYDAQLNEWLSVFNMSGLLSASVIDLPKIPSSIDVLLALTPFLDEKDTALDNFRECGYYGSVTLLHWLSKRENFDYVHKLVCTSL